MSTQGLKPGESPAQFEQRVLKASRQLTSPCGRGELVWRRWGDSTQTPLILLHGGFGSWRHYALNVLALAREYCVYAVDLPGLGDSAPLAAKATAEQIADTVSLGIDRVLPPDLPFHICGFSFGGIISGPVAVRQGARTLSYTGVGTGALGLPIGKLPNLVSPRASMTEAQLREVHAKNLALLMIHDPSRVDALAVHLQWETVRRARSRSGGIPSSTVLADALPDIAPETRINAIWGNKDVIAGPYLPERREWFGALPNAGEFRVLEDAGHWVMYERPGEFNETLLEVLAATEPGRLRFHALPNASQ
jgi:pimeloyl-ACP methyl ester carboxylesterase